MKLNGIVRKIDNLGRIVIPIELRKRLKIDQNDDIEIKIENNKIVLSKYNKLSELNNILYLMSKSYNNLIGINIIVTDKERIIYSNKEIYKNKNISKIIRNNIDNEIEIDFYKKVEITNDLFIESYIYSKNIKISGFSYGQFIIYSKNMISIKDKEILNDLVLLLSNILD
jgi:AbrB family looped-hinge helix DNA binding protein